MSWKYGLLGFGVISLACGGGADDSGSMLPACKAVTDVKILAASHSTYVYPSDKFGLSLAEMDGSIRVSGTVEDYSGLVMHFEPCVDLSAFVGVSLRVSGTAGTTDDLMLSMSTRDNTAAPGGTCKPTDATRTYTDCVASFVALPPTPGSYHFRWTNFAGGKPHGSGDHRQVTNWDVSFLKATSPYSTDVTIDQFELF